MKLRSRNFKAYWLLDVIVFKLERGRKPKNVDQQTEANETSGGKKSDSTGSGGTGDENNQVETGTPSACTDQVKPAFSDGGQRGASQDGVKTKKTETSKPSTEISEVQPVHSGGGPIGAGQSGVETKTGTLKPTTESSKVQPVISCSVPTGAGQSVKAKTGTLKPTTGKKRGTKPSRQLCWENGIIRNHF